MTLFDKLCSLTFERKIVLKKFCALPEGSHCIRVHVRHVYSCNSSKYCFLFFIRYSFYKYVEQYMLFLIMFCLKKIMMKIDILHNISNGVKIIIAFTSNRN